MERLRLWAAMRGYVLLPVMGPCGTPRGWIVRGPGIFVGADDIGTLAAMLGVAGCEHAA